MLKIKLENLNALYAKIAEKLDLFLPVVKAGELNYDKWEEGAEVNLKNQTVKSAKDFFFPQSEDLVAFKADGKKLEVIDLRKEVEPFVVFGVRACDYRSFDILDRVFLVEPIDTNYKTKREKAIVITLACSRPEESCFCNVFGIDPTSPLGDVTTYVENGNLYWIANTEKGKEFTESVKDLFENADANDEKAVEEQKVKTKAIMEKLPLSNLELKEFTPEALNELFNNSAWEELSQACLGCGSCTFVCPTCQCYDIRDFKTNDGVKRFRCWDSCMYADFTKMAHGNSRNFQLQRFRQRFMHKLVYYPSNNEGIYSCVGCGRCVKKCPISMNIAKVIKKLGGKN